MALPGRVGNSNKSSLDTNKNVRYASLLYRGLVLIASLFCLLVIVQVVFMFFKEDLGEILHPPVPPAWLTYQTYSEKPPVSLFSSDPNSFFSSSNTEELLQIDNDNIRISGFQLPEQDIKLYVNKTKQDECRSSEGKIECSINLREGENTIETRLENAYGSNVNWRDFDTNYQSKIISKSFFAASEPQLIGWKTSDYNPQEVSIIGFAEPNSNVSIAVTENNIRTVEEPVVTDNLGYFEYNLDAALKQPILLEVLPSSGLPFSYSEPAKDQLQSSLFKVEDLEQLRGKTKFLPRSVAVSISEEERKVKIRFNLDLPAKEIVLQQWIEKGQISPEEFSGVFFGFANEFSSSSSKENPDNKKLEKWHGPFLSVDAKKAIAELETEIPESAELRLNFSKYYYFGGSSFPHLLTSLNDEVRVEMATTEPFRRIQSSLPPSMQEQEGKVQYWKGSQINDPINRTQPLQLKIALEQQGRKASETQNTDTEKEKEPPETLTSLEAISEFIGQVPRVLQDILYVLLSTLPYIGTWLFLGVAFQEIYAKYHPKLTTRKFLFLLFLPRLKQGSLSRIKSEDYRNKEGLENYRDREKDYRILKYLKLSASIVITFLFLHVAALFLPALSSIFSLLSVIPIEIANTALYIFEYLVTHAISIAEALNIQLSEEIISFLSSSDGISRLLSDISQLSTSTIRGGVGTIEAYPFLLIGLILILQAIHECFFNDGSTNTQTSFIGRTFFWITAFVTPLIFLLISFTAKYLILSIRSSYRDGLAASYLYGSMEAYKKFENIELLQWLIVLLFILGVLFLLRSSIERLSSNWFWVFLLMGTALFRFLFREKLYESGTLFSIDIFLLTIFLLALASILLSSFFKELIRSALHISVSPKTLTYASQIMLLVLVIPFLFNSVLVFFRNLLLKNNFNPIRNNFNPYLIPTGFSNVNIIWLISSVCIGTVLSFYVFDIATKPLQLRSNINLSKKPWLILTCLIIFALLSLPIGEIRRASNLDLDSRIFSILTEDFIVSFLPYTLIFILFVLILEFNPKDSFILNNNVKIIGAMMASYYLIGTRTGSELLSVPFTLLGFFIFLSLILKPEYARNNEITSCKAIVKSLINYKRVESLIPARRKNLEKKLADGEMELDSFKKQSNEIANYQQGLEEALKREVSKVNEGVSASEETAASGNSNLSPKKTLFKQSPELYSTILKARQYIFAYGPEQGPWRNAINAVKFGVVFSLPFALVTLNQWFQGQDFAEYTYPFRAIAYWIFYIEFFWLLIAFIFGYFFHLIRGHDGFVKGVIYALFFVGLTISSKLISGESFWGTSSLIQMAQVVTYILLLALIAFDLRRLEKLGFTWRDLLTVHGLTTITAYASSIAISAVASFSGQDLIGLLTKLVTGG